MSLSDVIASLGAFELEVTRTAAGARSHGRYVPGPATTFRIIAGVEPISGRELRDLPEGRRGDEVLMLFTEARLVAAKSGIDADVVRYLGNDPDVIEMLGAGEPWTVIAVKTPIGLGGAHREVKIARAPSPAGAVP